jgi:hypothetical protein
LIFDKGIDQNIGVVVVFVEFLEFTFDDSSVIFFVVEVWGVSIIILSFQV